jgi:hypothetical protein
MPDYVTKLTNWSYREINETIDCYGNCYLTTVDIDTLKAEAKAKGLDVDLQGTVVIFTRRSTTNA